MPKIVLIVEDSETCAETLEVAFSSLKGAICRRVQSAAEAQALMAGPDPPAALVTDLHLRSPLNGLDLIRDIRSNERFHSLPIVLISGDSDPELEHRARVAGVNAFFSRPYSPAAVRRALEEFLC